MKLQKQKVWRLFGFTGLIVGILLALTPFNLAHVCTRTMELASGMLIPMNCHWSGITEVILGIVVAVNGLLVILAGTENPRFLVLMLGVIGVAVMVMPTDLGIGICGNSEMACHTTKAVMNIWGGVLIVLGLGGQFIHLAQEKN